MVDVHVQLSLDQVARHLLRVWHFELHLTSRVGCAVVEAVRWMEGSFAKWVEGDLGTRSVGGRDLS